MYETVNLSSTCDFVYKNDAINISVTIIRTTALMLYLIWIIFGIKFKELHKRDMIFLYNLNLSGMLYGFLGSTNLLKKTCWVPTQIQCILTTLHVTFNSYLPGYCLSALFLYRLACVCYVNIRSELKWSRIILLLSITWLIPLILSVIHTFAFGSNFVYSKELATCIVIDKEYKQLIIFIIFGFIVPNLLIISSYTSVYFKLTKIRKNPEPLRITIQLILMIIFFEIYCITSLIAILQVDQTYKIIPKKWFNIIRVIRWIYYFCPLSLLYTHSVIIKKAREQNVLKFKNDFISLIKNKH